MMSVQFVEIAGHKMAVLSLTDYERLLDLAEDRADTLAAESADLRRQQGEEFVPAALLDRIVAGEHPLRVWRTYRGLTLDELGQATGSRKSFLSQIENWKGEGRPMLWRRLAEALNVSVDDILPLD